MNENKKPDATRLYHIYHRAGALPRDNKQQRRGLCDYNINHEMSLPPYDLRGSSMMLLYNQNGSPAFPQVFLDQQAGNSRQIQFGLKLIF